MSRPKSQSRSVPHRRPHRKLTRDDKLRFISQYQRVKDPFNTRAVNRQYKRLKAFPLELQKNASKEQREGLKKRGFFVTGKGVVVDGPRDSRRKPIKTRRFKVLGKGEGVKWTVNGRRDYIIGLSDAERREFARDPSAFLKAHRAMMRAKYQDFRNARDVQTRLQWGAYQATKDFSVSQFAKQSSTRAIVEHPNRRSKVLDRLTGIHYVIHLPRKKRVKRKRK